MQQTDAWQLPAVQVIFGPAGAILMALAILVSTFGCNNGLILSGARIYYAMAKDRLFFASAGTVNRQHAPGVALVVQCMWASVLCLSGTYGQLLDFLIFAVVIFYILTLDGTIPAALEAPELKRPYRAFGYPFLPALYIVMAVFLEIQLLRYKPQYTWPGLIIVLLGFAGLRDLELGGETRSSSVTRFYEGNCGHADGRLSGGKTKWQARCLPQSR